MNSILCDELENLKEQRTETKLKLNDAALHRLMKSQDVKEFGENWNLICDNFDLLYDTPETVKKLRQAILELAVRGKLVEQDPGDGSAANLLRMMHEIKTNQPKVRKQKILNHIIEHSEGLHGVKIPENWSWCYMDQITKKVTDGEHSTPRRAASGFYLLSARNVRNDGISLDDVDYVPEHEFRRLRKRCDPDKNDILISCSGSVGRIAIVDRDNAYVMVRSAALVKPFHDHIDSKFLAFCLRSPLLQDQIAEKSRQSAQANLFLGRIKELVIALPPRKEQKRIVAKVEQLMAQCDELETWLEASRKLSENLMAAVVNQFSTN